MKKAEVEYALVRKWALQVTGFPSFLLHHVVSG